MSKEMAPPPSSFGKGQRGKPVVKPKDMKGTLRRLWELTQGQRQGLGWLMLLSAVASASTILSPLLIGTAVTAIDTGNPALQLLILLAALYLTDWLVRFLQQFFMAAIGQRIILHIRSTLFEKMKALPLSFFDSRQHGELMSRLTNDVDNISTTISDSLTQLMTYGFTIIGILCIMLRLSLPLTCIAFISVWLIFLLTRTITKHTRKLFAQQQQILGKLNGQVEESISGLNMVKAFGREAEMTEQFEESNARLCHVATKAQIWSGFLMPLTNVINNLNFVIVAVVSGILAAYGRISVGLISSFLLYSRQFSRPFVDIANIYNNFQTAVAGAERIFEILEEEPEPADAPDALPLTAPRGEVEFSHVTFGYQAQEPVLKDVSFRVPAGTRVAVVGSTGAGKTTLINLLTRFYDVNSGSILLDGRDLRQYRLQDLRRTFGVVLQDTALFGMSVRDNISYGNKDVLPERIRAAAKTAGADSFIRRLPQGYDTPLSGETTGVSQGQMQLLTIARAMLKDAPIVILDEATASVDPENEAELQAAISSLTKGKTLILIAHRLKTVQKADQILVLDQGRLTGRGTHQELLENCPAYREIVESQMQKKEA